MSDTARVKRMRAGPSVAIVVTTLTFLTPVISAQRSYGPGVCGPIDPVYVRTATETGGQPFPMAPTEIGKSVAIMSESSRGDATMLLWAGGNAADAERAFAVPIDPSVRRVTFAITFDGRGGGAEIVAPDGTVIQPAASAGDVILNCGRILSIDAPAAGVWRVMLTPSERFWIVIHARSDRDILSAEFVRAGGRPGHEGLFPIRRMPIAGRPATLRVRLSEPEARTPDFLLLSSQGREIQRVALNRVDAEEFVGEITLPAVPFRVATVGTDDAGAAYQRIYKALFRGETVEVVSSNVDTIKAGEDTPLTFVVRNHGAKARYRIVATVGAEILKRVEPPIVDIDANSEQGVNVWLPAATIEAAGASLELLVVASSENPSSSSANSAFHRVSIERK
ncbi:MAG TPA: hypothetical protein VFJ02_22915 [Vicinamibacterales bacterium]|nr:hypothetical protein [Vicinamibacterales bacterium]